MPTVVAGPDVAATARKLIAEFGAANVKTVTVGASTAFEVPDRPTPVQTAKPAPRKRTAPVPTDQGDN